MNCDVPNATALAAVLILALFAVVLAVVAERTRFFQRAVQWIQKRPVVRTALVVLLLAIGPITARTKNGQLSLPRPSLLLHVDEPPPEPAIAPVSVRTNGVALRPESTNAVEVTAFRTIGGTELGDWIETAEPFFAIGTNPVSRCYVSASGSISFNSMRRPPVGSALPDGSGLSVLCPLRAPLGMVPEARWAQVFGQDEQDCQDEQDSPASGYGAVPVNPENPAKPVHGSCFWHDALPGGGRVLTWENALVDRLPGRRVSLQVEMRPTGDCIYRYAFHDALDPPPTNFVMGAQMGTNGVNALSILGTNTLAATVWNVDGAPVTNGVSIAYLLCTNGVLRTPATFEIRWKNTTGLDPEADTDNDGLTDWAESFVWGTEAEYADTDGDGTADNVELVMGADPFDADEDGDGVPDGMYGEDWLAHPLWAANATNEANVRVTLQSRPLESATLVIGSLSIPLGKTASWDLSLPIGVAIPIRLFSSGDHPVNLSITDPAAGQPLLRNVRSNGTTGPFESSGGTGFWLDDPFGIFSGTATSSEALCAIPVLGLTPLWGSECSCVHSPPKLLMHGVGGSVSRIVIPCGQVQGRGDNNAVHLVPVGLNDLSRTPKTKGGTTP